MYNNIWYVIKLSKYYLLLFYFYHISIVSLFNKSWGKSKKASLISYYDYFCGVFMCRWKYIHECEISGTSINAGIIDNNFIGLLSRITKSFMQNSWCRYRKKLRTLELYEDKPLSADLRWIEYVQFSRLAWKRYVFSSLGMIISL